jgi:hemerythrin-like metal-binding protein
MNEEHQHLLGLADRYEQALDRQAPKTELVMIFEEVLDYARAHFREEETFMRGAGYPALEAHRRDHEWLMGQITELLLKLRAAEDYVQLRARSFLREWLSGHFEEYDGRFESYLKDKPR